MLNGMVANVQYQIRTPEDVKYSLSCPFISLLIEFGGPAM